MGTIEQNKRAWGDSYDWEAGGDEWSAAFGGTEAEWLTCILPRLERFLPATSIVEIAPGFGRWSQFLIPRCSTYVGIDLADRCVQACRDRFAAMTWATFVVNDGRSLPTVPDHSVDLVFSFDSLVHVDDTTLAHYLAEVRRVLNDDGVGFIHHSNIGHYRRARAVSFVLEHALGGTSRVRHGLQQLGVIDWQHWRDWSMTDERFCEIAIDGGLSCIGQELVNWYSPRFGELRLIDCISVVTLPGSRWDRANVRVRNRSFMAAARASAAASRSFLSLGDDQARMDGARRP